MSNNFQPRVGIIIIGDEILKGVVEEANAAAAAQSKLATAEARAREAIAETARLSAQIEVRVESESGAPGRARSKRMPPRDRRSRGSVRQCAIR